MSTGNEPFLVFDLSANILFSVRDYLFSCIPSDEESLRFIAYSVQLNEFYLPADYHLL